jgi:hypothetical protein
LAHEHRPKGLKTTRSDATLTERQHSGREEHAESKRMEARDERGKSFEVGVYEDASKK